MSGSSVPLKRYITIDGMHAEHAYIGELVQKKLSAQDSIKEAMEEAITMGLDLNRLANLPSLDLMSIAHLVAQYRSGVREHDEAEKGLLALGINASEIRRSSKARESSPAGAEAPKDPQAASVESTK